MLDFKYIDKDAVVSVVYFDLFYTSNIVESLKPDCELFLQ